MRLPIKAQIRTQKNVKCVHVKISAFCTCEQITRKRDIVTGTTVAVSTDPFIVSACQVPSISRVETTNDHLIISTAYDPRVRRRLNVRTRYT